MFLPDFNDKYVFVFNCTCISLYARLNLVLLFWYFLIGFRNKLYTVTKLLLQHNTSGIFVYKSAKSFCKPNTLLTVFCIHLIKQTTKKNKEKQYLSSSLSCIKCTRSMSVFQCCFFSICTILFPLISSSFSVHIILFEYFNIFFFFAIVLTN